MSVTSKLYGRMGNQMFQVAAAYGYAKAWNLDFFVPIQTVAPRVFPYYLNDLKATKRKQIPSFYKVYKEPSHAYHEIPYMTNVVLDGYFQSAKYFDTYRDGVLEMFAPMFPYTRLDGFVGLHVRRGDYVQMSDKHPPVTYEYIKKAVLYFNELGYYSFVVCSDDLAWCKQELKGLEVYGNVFSYSHAEDPFKDLSLLACCEHQIISNSTFSWWAHYLNQNPDKKAIAPERWFGEGNAHLRNNDIYLPTMIRM